jgi:hypothetical protein
MLHRLTCLVLMSLVPASIAASAPLNTLTPAEKKAGWRLLFDGATLSGWRGYKTETPAGWNVQDGALVLAAGRKGDLVTVEQFGDFELSLEWKISAGGNSGIIYRVGLGDPAPARSGPEYQLLDNARAKDNQIPTHFAGALYDLVAPPRDVTRPVGEWNEARVRIQGWKIEHWLNGTKVAEADLSSPAGKALVAGSKFKTWPRFATLARGHITLQDHGDSVSFRNVKIRELK